MIWEMLQLGAGEGRTTQRQKNYPEKYQVNESI